MGNGAFRDASAAIERAAMLEQENEQLRTEGSERKLAAAELQRKRSNGLGNAVEPVLERIIGLFRPK